MPVHHPRPVLLVYEPPADWKILPPNADGGHVNEFLIKGYELYKADPAAFSGEARRQWNEMNRLHEKHGATVIKLPRYDGPQEGMIYTADPFLSLVTEKGVLKVMFSNFSNPRRTGEAAFYEEYFKTHYPHAVTMISPYRTEGTGDNVYDPYRDLYWSGYTADPVGGKPSDGRSDIRSHEILQQFMGVEVVSLEVRAPCHHIDTSLAPLTHGHMICYPGGQQPGSFERYKKRAFDDFGLDRDEYMIEAGEEDAKKLVCNIRCIGNTVFIPNCSDELKKAVESRGRYKVVPLELSHIAAAGGADHCTGNNINETRIPGGYIRQPGNF